jgi:hypothetical protein
VARIYAGILGPLALLTSLAHGFIHAADVKTILLGAWSSLVIFATVGYVVGGIAGRTVEESVQATVQAQLDREESADERQTAHSAA